MISLAIWLAIGAAIGYFLFYLGSTIIEIITGVGECFGDNGGIIIWILIIFGILALFII